MRKVIREWQNNGKALEIRLEEESPSKFIVVVAGMTVNLKSGSANYEREAGDDDYMFFENDTYMEYPFSSYRLANEAYDVLKLKYID